MKIICMQGSVREQAQLQNFLDLVRKEDVIVVLSISRMARDINGLSKLIEAMAELDRASTTEHRAGEIPKGTIGRPRKALETFISDYMDVKAGRKSVSRCCRESGIARSTWYRKVREFEDDQEIDF